MEYYALLISNIIRFSSFFVLTRIITVLYSLDPFHKPVCNSCILVKPKIESLQIFMCLNEEMSETFYPKPTFYLEYLNVLSLKARKFIFHDWNIIYILIRSCSVFPRVSRTERLKSFSRFIFKNSFNNTFKRGLLYKIFRYIDI